MDDSKNIIKLLEDYKNNLVIFSITKKINPKIEDKPDSQGQLDFKFFRYQYSQNENYFNSFFEERRINFLFDELSKNLINFDNKIIFIIFNEYFFGKEICKKEELSLICGKIKSLSDNFPKIYLFFFVNLFIEENNINFEDMKVYQQFYDISNLSFLFSKRNIIYNNKDIKYSNTTFIIYNGVPIIKYLKSSYSEEKYPINYKFGFGNLILIKEDELSKKLSEIIDIYLCMDITIRPYYELIKTTDFSFSGNKNAVERIKKLQSILNNYQTLKQKIIIIQSNSIDISTNLYNFEDGTIIIQVDPKVSSVFKISFNKIFRNKINDCQKDYDENNKYILNNKKSDELSKNTFLFQNKLNYFIFKKDIFAKNCLGICKYYKSILNYVAIDNIFSIEINAFNLNDLNN